MRVLKGKCLTQSQVATACELERLGIASFNSVITAYQRSDKERLAMWFNEKRLSSAVRGVK